MSPPSRTTAGLAAAVLTASVGTSAANVALPALADAFSATSGEVQWVVVAYLLGMTGASVVVGALGDRWGRRRVLLAGIALFAVTALIGATAPTLLALILARGAQGVGAAVMTALPLALARDVTMQGSTGRVMGLLGTTSAVGTALGPALGGALVGWGGWPTAFWMMVSLGALTLLLALTVPSGAAPRVPRRFDVAGAVLLAAGIATYALALTPSAPEWPAALLLIGAGILLGVFITIERRASNPLLPVAMVRRPAVAIGMITNILVATVMMTTLVVGPYALHDGLGLPLTVVGLVMSVGPVTSAVSGTLAGRLVDRTPPSAMITYGLGAMTAGAAALAILPGWWGVAGYVVALLVLTPGYQLFLAANSTHVLASSDTTQRGTIAGLLGLARNLGLITGASAMGGIYAALVGGAGDGTHEPLDAMRVTFLIAALLAAVGAIVSLVSFRAPAR